MKHKHKTSKNVVRKTMTALLLFFLTLSSVHILFNGTFIIISEASSENIAWDVTVTITESDGAGNDVVFGEASNATDGEDYYYDWIQPPHPPQLSYLVARFDTSLDKPYDKLWHEYRHYPNDYNVWNLSILWIPEPGEESSFTTIDISWNVSEIAESEYDSVLLYENDTIVADMLTENGYTFDSPGETLHRFQIICQSETSDSDETPFISFIFILIMIFLFTLYWKKNN